MKPLFTIRDRTIVRDKINFLPKLQARAIHLRFWEQCTVADIASEFGKPWDEVNDLLKEALRNLRKLCIAHREFSRRLPVPREQTLSSVPLASITPEQKDQLHGSVS